VEKEKLFTEFPPVTTEKWEEVIKADLKGADYEKKLIWKSNEGIRVKPYYRSEDIPGSPYLKSLPGNYPYVRGNKADANTWEIRQDIEVSEISSANKAALEAIQNGCTSIAFLFGGKKLSKTDFSKLVQGIEIGCINFNIADCSNSSEVLDFINEEVSKKGYAKEKMQGSVSSNPLTILSSTGNWNESAEMNAAYELIQKAEKNLPAYHTLNIDGYIFQEAGSSIVQEIAYSLSMATEYLNRFTEKGLKPEEIVKHIRFNFSVSSNYFMEIAKIRAFRVLWANLVKAYNVSDENLAKAFVHSSTTGWNMTIYDAYVNVLRATTESMSAIIAGTDSLSVKPFDAIYKNPNEFSYRIARNIQIILKEEAYFDKVVDPSSGSYYIENLTDSIATEAWRLFQKIENEGGYLSALEKGSIQADIEAVASKKSAAIASRRDTLLGTNQYPNFNEKVLNNIENTRKTNENCVIIVKPLKTFRGSEVFEELRIATEKSGKRPKVFMLTIGNLAMRLARSQFSSNFFGCAGFEVIDNNGFASIEAGVKAAFEAKADIIVLCSSDDEYATFAPEAHNLTKGKSILTIAGAPACQPELEAKGIKNYISMKSNILETLKYYQQLTGIIK
jgi:methylmalonyl-CoA mutase